MYPLCLHPCVHLRDGPRRVFIEVSNDVVDGPICGLPRQRNPCARRSNATCGAAEVELEFRGTSVTLLSISLSEVLPLLSQYAPSLRQLPIRRSSRGRGA